MITSADTSVENLAFISEPKFCQMSKKINKYNFSFVYFAFLILKLNKQMEN